MPASLRKCMEVGKVPREHWSCEKTTTFLSPDGPEQQNGETRPSTFGLYLAGVM